MSITNHRHSEQIIAGAVGSLAAVGSNTYWQAHRPDSSNTKGAFGEVITAHKTPVVQIANKYQLDPTLLDTTIETFSATGGTTDNNTNEFRCQTGTAIGGYGVIRSKETINYHAGQGIEALFTAHFTEPVALSLQFGGLFNLTDTLAFGYDGLNFSCLHSHSGHAEMQEITITATGAGTCTVILDNDSVDIAVTNSTPQVNAHELFDGLEADVTLASKWRFEQIDNKVYCIAKATRVEIGTFSVTGGITASIVETHVGKPKTDNHTAQADWNVTSEPFVGFDPNQLNIYKIRLGYLGAANIEYSIYNPRTGRFVLVHTLAWANDNLTTHISSPNLKIGWTAASLGSSGTNLIVEGASGALFIEGDEVISNGVHAVDHTELNVGTTLTNIITIKNRLIHGAQYNLGKVLPLRASLSIDHTKGAIVEVIKNATVAGDRNFQLHEEGVSIVAYDTVAGTVTGGDIIDGFPLSASGSQTIDLSGLLVKLLPEDTLTIAARTVSQVSDSVTGFLTWKEEK